MPISARDVERAHRTQLKRWRKKRGEPSRKGSQRLHSARAIMANEPHTRQDLRQNPTIIVQYPSVPEEISVTSHRRKRGSLNKNQIPFPNITNPYALPSESKLGQILETQPLNKEHQDAVPPSPPSYPPPLPTEQDNQVKVINTSTERLLQSSVYHSTNQKPAESLHLQDLSLQSAPAQEASSQWRPHLLDTLPVQFPKPVPDHGDLLPNNKENSVAIFDPPKDSLALRTHSAPANNDSIAAPDNKNSDLRNSTGSINSSEDTYL